MNLINIAIDGPAGAGKSTIAKLLAHKLSIIYVDTGAMYRAIGYYVVNNCGVNLDFTKDFSSDTLNTIYQFSERNLVNINIDIEYNNGEQHILLNKIDISALIRTPEMGKMASIVSSNKQVRLYGIKLQQILAHKSSVVMDGRDIGTFVLPNAPLKIYLTANSTIRAKRRFDQLLEKGEAPNLNKLKLEIEERDMRDMSRDFAPLKKADDAIEVDTSYMNINEVVEYLYKLTVETFSIDCDNI